MRNNSKRSRKTYAIVIMVGVISALIVLLVLVLTHRNNDPAPDEQKLDSNGHELPKLEGDIRISDYLDQDSNSTTSLTLDSPTKIVAYIKKINCETEDCKPAIESGTTILTQDEYDKAKLIYDSDSFVTEGGQRSDVVINWLLALAAITKDEEIMTQRSEIEDSVWAQAYAAYDVDKNDIVTQREWGDGLLDTIITSYGISSEK